MLELTNLYFIDNFNYNYILIIFLYYVIELINFILKNENIKTELYKVNNTLELLTNYVNTNTGNPFIKSHIDKCKNSKNNNQIEIDPYIYKYLNSKYIKNKNNLFKDIYNNGVENGLIYSAKQLMNYDNTIKRIVSLTDNKLYIEKESEMIDLKSYVNELYNYKFENFINDITLIKKAYKSVTETVIFTFIGNIEIGKYLIKKILNSDKYNLLNIFIFNINIEYKQFDFLLTKFNNKIIFISKEYGNDIIPTLQAFNKCKELNFKYVIKLHTKGNIGLLNKAVDCLLFSNVEELLEKRVICNCIGHGYSNIKRLHNRINNKNEGFWCDKLINKYKKYINKQLFIYYSIFLCEKIVLNKMIEFISKNNYRSYFLNNMYDTNEVNVEQSPIHFLERLFGIIDCKETYNIIGLLGINCSISENVTLLKNYLENNGHYVNLYDISEINKVKNSKNNIICIQPFDYKCKNIIELKYKPIALWVWEFKSLPNIFKYMEKYYKEIITVSDFCLEVFTKNLTIPVRKIELKSQIHNYLDKIPNHVIESKTLKSLLEKTKNRTVYGYCFDVNSSIIRKNVLNLVKAFSKMNNDKQILILKTRPYRSRPNSLENSIINQLYKIIENSEHIYIINKQISILDLYKLYTYFDYYISPHCGEGYGLTIYDNMVLGNKIISPYYSGEKDYLDRSKIIELNYEEKDINGLREHCIYGQMNDFKGAYISENNIIGVINVINNSSNTLYVLGNGPSLKNINFKDLENEDTFCLNSSYKKFKELDFYPTYFGCFDPKLIECHYDKFLLLMNNSDIKNFFFLNENNRGKKQFTEEEQQHKKYVKINFLPPEKNYKNCSFDKFYKMNNSGATAALIGILLGYKRIILLGCDGNYVEQIPESKLIDPSTKTLQITETPKKNPNYWFDNYQEKGEIYSLPDLNTCHMKGWELLYQASKFHNVEIINGNTESKIPYFEKSKYKIPYFEKRKLIYKIISKKQEKIIINNEITINLKKDDIFTIYYYNNYILFLNSENIAIQDILEEIKYTNKNNYDLSIVLPVSLEQLHYESKINFNYVLKEYIKIIKDCQNIQLCLTHTEKDYNNFIDQTIRNNNINYIFVKNPYNFNLGYNRNIWKYVCNSNKIMFNDIDIPLNKGHLIELIKNSKYYDIVKPYDKNLIHTDRKEKDLYIKNNTIPNKKPKCLFSITGGITLFDKKVLLETGGYEELNKHGYEDRFLDVIVLNNGYSIKRLDNKIVHLYHPEISFYAGDFDYINKKFYNCSINKDCRDNIHEKCNHIKDTSVISDFNKKYNGNLNSINLKDFKINYELIDFTITLLGYNKIKKDGSRHTNWFPWNRFKDVYETIGYKCEWTTLEKIERKDEKRLFITWNEPTSLELYQSGKVKNDDIVFQKLTSLGKGMENVNWTENPKKWCEEWHWPIYRTVEYLYDLGLNIYAFGCKTDINLFSEKKRICEKLKDRIHWISWGGTPFNWEQIKNCKPKMNNLNKDISFVGSKWGKIGRGNLDAWEKYIEPFESKNCKYIFNKYGGIGSKMVTDDEMIKILQTSKLCPIIHAPSWQAERGIQDRFYTVFLSGRFGICDNLGAVDIFGDEIKDICTENPEEYHKKSIYYFEHPEEQIKYIEMIQKKIKEKFNFYRQWESVFNNINLQNNRYKIDFYKEIKSPFIGIDVPNFNSIIELNYNYINEILLLHNYDIKDYFLFKLCKEFDFKTNSYNYTKYSNEKFLKIIRSEDFINKYHKQRNFDITTLNEIVKYHKNTNFELIKKNDIRYKKIVKNYIFKDNINLIEKCNITLLHSEKLFTFIMIIKNRNSRAKKSIEFLVNNITNNICNFIVVEDKSNNLLDLKDFKYRHFIKHYVVDSKCRWNRSGLLNYGIKRCNTPYFIGWDCDFYITENLVFDIKKLILNYKPKNIVGIGCFDTDICDLGESFNLPCTPYTYLWLYNTDIIKSVGMFNYEFIGWGLEERELEERIKNKYGLDVIKTNLSPCFHYSHNNSTRSTRNVYHDFLLNEKIYIKTKNEKIKEINNYIDYDLLEYKYYVFNYQIPYNFNDIVKNINHLDELKEYIKNKELSLVGPAGYMENSNSGKHIDNTISIKCNNIGKLSSEKFGNNCNVLFNCFDEEEENGNFIDYELLKTKNIKFLVLSHGLNLDNKYKSYLQNRDKKLGDWNTDFQKKCLLDIIDKKPKWLKLVFVPDDIYFELEEKIKCLPNTGMCALYFLHKLNNFKRLNIYGLTFFLDGYSKDYRNYDSKGVMERMDRTKNHKQYPQLKLFKNEIIKNKKINVDKYILDLININKNVTFIIKTCYRPKLAERLFESIRKYYPIIKIIICDDGEPKMNKKLFDINTKYIDNYKDIGLSKGRNVLVENVETKYTLLLDDDFVFYEKTDIELLYYNLIWYNYDILSAKMLDFYNYEDFKRMNYKERVFRGIIKKEKNCLLVETEKFNKNNCYDFTINFFICETKLLLENKWDDELKLIEHLEFFYRLIKKFPNIRIQNDETVMIYHIRDSEYSKLYNTIRYNLDEYSKLLHKKLGVDKIFLNGKITLG